MAAATLFGPVFAGALMERFGWKVMSLAMGIFAASGAIPSVSLIALQAAAIEVELANDCDSCFSRGAGCFRREGIDRDIGWRWGMRGQELGWISEGQADGIRRWQRVRYSHSLALMCIRESPFHSCVRTAMDMLDLAICHLKSIAVRRESHKCDRIVFNALNWPENVGLCRQRKSHRCKSWR